MVRRFFLMSCFGLIFFLQAQAYELPVHHIVAIHGIGSQHQQFGSLKEALEQHLRQRDRTQNYQVSYFDFDVGNHQRSQEEFSADLGLFLRNSIYSKMTKSQNPQDSLSIVTFSEGGIIFNQWLIASLKNPRKETQFLLNRLQTVTAIATPYWGAEMAKLGVSLARVFGRFLSWNGFGHRQIVDMAPGSDAIYQRQIDLLNPKVSQKLYDLQKRVRWIQLVGTVHPELYGIPYEFLDHDLAVAAASAQFGFRFYQGPALDKVIKPEQSLKPFPVKHYIVEGVHPPSLDNLVSTQEASRFKWNYPSLVDIPKKCIQAELKSCRSPSLEYIVNNILDLSQSIRPDKPSSQFFIYFELIENPFNQLKIKSDGAQVTLKNEALLQVLSKSSSVAPPNFEGNHWRWGFVGRFADWKAHDLDFQIQDSFGKIKTIQVHVTPGETQFLKIYL